MNSKESGLKLMIIGALFIIFGLMNAWLGWQIKSSDPTIETEYVEVKTPPEVYISYIPVTVIVTPTPTNSPTPTLSPFYTPSPTATPKPTKIPTPKPPKPTKTPTPKPTKKAESNNIVAYPTGAVGTQYTDNPNGHTWKPLARYTAITNKNSVEYKLREKERTDENGLRYLIDPNGVKRYCIALEPQWAGGQSVDIGRCIDVLMTNGATLHCVLCDCKRHEKSWNKEGRYGSKGELLEFIVDLSKVSKKVKDHGDASYVSKEFEGGITSITVLDLYIEGFGH